MDAQEVTMEERMELLGQTVTLEQRVFHQAWREYNRSVGFKDAVSVMDNRDIRLMEHFFRAGQQAISVPVFRRLHRS